MAPSCTCFDSDLGHHIPSCPLSADSRVADEFKKRMSQVVSEGGAGGGYDKSPIKKAPERLETVNHPKHYGGADNPYEVIKVMRAWLSKEEYIGAAKFNVHKYLSRAHLKGGAEDYEKACWYLRDLVEYLKEHV